MFQSLRTLQSLFLTNIRQAQQSISKDSIVYADNEGFDISKESYGEYELIVFRDQTSPLIVVYMEKNGTYIAITGQLSMEQIHSIIDSLVVDESI